MDQPPQESTPGLEAPTVEAQPQESTPDMHASAGEVQPPQEPKALPPSRQRLVLILSALAIVLVVGASFGSYLVITHAQRPHSTTTRAHPTPTATISLAQRWRLVDSPTIGKDFTQLFGVAASSPTDAWAWGRDTSPSPSLTSLKPLLLHWDGQSWKPIAVPYGQHTLEMSINGIVALAPDNAWLVGSALEGMLLNNKEYGITDIPCVILHWDGQQVHQVLAYPPPLQVMSCELNDIAALSATDIWAVGRTQVFDRQADTILEEEVILHWNGQQWSVVPAPSPGASRWLTQITARAANDIWAIGSLQQHILPVPTVGQPTPPEPPTYTLIEHWDGQQWSEVSSPSPGTQDNTLSGITALAPNDVWVVGNYTNKDGASPFTMHWDGQHWSVVPGPALPGNPQESSLTAVAALGPDDIWAVGSSTPMALAVSPPSVKASQMLIEHWDGKQWSIVAVQAPGVGSALYGLARVPNTGQLWAVGAWSQSQDPTTPITTLTLLLAPEEE